MRPLTWLRIQADRVAAVTLVAGGIVAILIGWAQASNALLATQQIPYLISGGLFGLLLVGVGSALWLSADLRDEWRGLKRIEDELRRIRVLQEQDHPETFADVDVASSEEDGSGPQLAVERTRRIAGAILHP